MTAANDLEHKIYSVLTKHLLIPAEDLNLGLSLYDNLEMDSLALIEVVLDLEEHYDCEIPNELIDQFKTVGDIHQALKATLSRSQQDV